MWSHYNDVIIGRIASQITRLTTVYSIVYSCVDQRKHQSSASLAFVRGIHWRPVNSPHKWPVTRKKFPFDDVIMATSIIAPCHYCAPDRCHYSDVKISAVASQITAVSIVYSTVCSGAAQRKHQGSASLAFARVIHR